MGKIPPQDVVAMKVKCYANLTKSVVSVVAMEGRYKGFVAAHSSHIYLRNCQFTVSLAGNRRVRAEKKKYVHAYVHGTVTRDRTGGNEPLDLVGDGFTAVYYNPYKHTTFVGLPHGDVVVGAEEVLLLEFRGKIQIWAKGVY